MSNSSKSAEPTDATEVRFSIRAMLIVMAVATSALTAFAPFLPICERSSHSTGAFWRCSWRRCLYSTRGDAEGRK